MSIKSNVILRYTHIKKKKDLPGSFPTYQTAKQRQLSKLCMHACMHAKLLQSCLTLRDPMDSSPPSSSVHRILYPSFNSLWH